MYLKAGDVFEDKYRIVRRLGRGGMGTVYQAVDVDIDRDVALKCIRERLLVDDDSGTALERLKREAHMLTRVRHPGVMQLFGYGLDVDGVPYMVTEFIPGKPLRYPPLETGSDEITRWARWRPLLAAIDQLLEILAEVHAADLVHRDLKPENILLLETYGGASLVRLLDFGLTRLLRGGRPADAGWMRQLSRGALVGTLDYMASEQFDSRSAQTPRTDLYAVGVMLYRGLSGRFPYPRIGNVLHQEDVEVRRSQPARALSEPVPAPLREVVQRALSLEPDRRPGSAAEFRAELRVAIQRSGPTPPPALPDPLQAVGAAPSTDATTERFDEAPSRPPGGGDGAGEADERLHLDTCVVVLPDTGDPLLDQVYAAAVERVIAPAVARVPVPDHGAPLLVTQLTARDLFRRSTSRRAMELLEFSRVVLWEKSRLGPESVKLLSFHASLGNTGVLHLAGQPVPAELRHLPAVRYQDRTDLLEVGRAAIRQLVRRRLRQRWRPVALRQQWRSPRATTHLLMSASRQVASGRDDRALRSLDEIIGSTPGDSLARFRRAHLRASTAGSRDHWNAVANDLRIVVETIPECAAAWRDLGVAWNRLGLRARALHCLRKAIDLDPYDFDAHSSYGGVLKKQAAAASRSADRRYAEALLSYEHGKNISDGHPYPLLNWLRLHALREGELALDEATRNQLERTVVERAAQAAAGVDLPWCHFDQIEALIYLGRSGDAAKLMDRFLHREREHATLAVMRVLDDTLEEMGVLVAPEDGSFDALRRSVRRRIRQLS